MPPSSAQGVQVDPQLLTADCLPGTQSYSGKSFCQPIKQRLKFSNQLLFDPNNICGRFICLSVAKRVNSIGLIISERSPVPEKDQAGTAFSDSD